MAKLLLLWLGAVVVLSCQVVLGEELLEGSRCSTSHTTCSRSNGSPTCCPLPNAVCCPGGDTCCPTGETCSSDACYKGMWVWPLLRYKGLVTATSPALGRMETNPEDTRLESSVSVKEKKVCPDGEQCKSGQTCCKIFPDLYSCCPLPRAVCCPDLLHCCPEDTVCSDDSTTCYKADVTLSSYGNSSQLKPPSFNQVEPWMTEKRIKPNSIPMVKLSSNAQDSGRPVICPDKSQCVPGSTCCKMGDGNYGCCPLPNAVCCKDGLHCCQNGTKCGKTRCIASNDSWLTPLTWRAGEA
ncbi:progranulin-like [Oratosquilla oratoria]|uniref:progranulin-like n=1 Tax=Oratosquilla oratoria TaxID=337810 RepID=UPI003F75B2EC